MIIFQILITNKITLLMDTNSHDNNHNNMNYKAK